MAGFIEIAKRASSTVTKLSEVGREFVEECLASGKTYDQTIAALKEKTGEVLSRSSLSRWRRTDFEPSQQRIEAVKQVALTVGEAFRNGSTPEEQFDGTAHAVFAMLLKRSLELEDTDVTKLARLGSMFMNARVNLKRADMLEKRLSLDREKLDLDRRELEKKLSDFEAKQAAARDAAAEIIGTRTLTPEAIERIRGLYGL